MFFVKMHGAGNDYIFVQSPNEKLDMSRLAVEMSDRHFGIGGDGVVFMCPSSVADIKMRMFNADGSEGAMCGNAVRCIAKLMRDKLHKDEIAVETASGVKIVRYAEDDLFTVDMGAPVVAKSDCILGNGSQISYTYVSMGNPHCVIFTKIDDINGAIKEIESRFPDGINIEFVEGTGTNLKVRVFERGSGETLSCGTGACASVVAGVLSGKCPKNTDINVILRGGTLKVNFNQTIYLTGNAVKVYEGVYYDKVHFCDRRSGQRTW